MGIGQSWSGGGRSISKELNDKANLHTLGKFSEIVSLANLVGKKCLLLTLVLLKTHPHLVGGRILRGLMLSSS